MSAPHPPGIPQMGGMRQSALEEVQIMTGHFILLGLVLLSVYVSRIPTTTITYFRQPLYQFLGLVLILILTTQYGWIHGILAALAYALVVSRALRTKDAKEGLLDYIPFSANTLVIEDPDSTYVPENHRWFIERVMGETPFLIREKEVKTSAVQDLSERSMGSSTVTR
jgi:hypothetical protein